jgi:alpha-soluble NSF attachment protein
MDDGLGSQHDAVSDRIQAAECYRRVDPNKAVGLYKAVVATQCELGKFGRAAQILETVGEIYEAQNNVEEALEAYSKAADYHSSENAGSRASKCLEKVALLSASAGEYDHSSRTFEQLGTSALESNLLKFGAKKHFMHSGFCYLARGDAVAARMAYDRFSQMDLSFANSREAKVLDDVIVAYDEMNTEAFSTALADYDRVCTLNAWETSLLLRIKKTIDETANAAPDLR